MKKHFRNIITDNVKLSYLYTALQSFGRGIWMGNILSLYIVVFAERSNGLFGLTPNELLGVASGITGISMTALVFPSGALADKFGRDKLLKTAAFFGIAAMITMAFSSSMAGILVALFLWGAFQGLNRPAFQSILADSLVTGKRSKVYARMHLVRQGGMAFGPFLNIVLFLYLGDKWDISILRSVMLVGIVFSLVSALLLFFFKDARSLGDESESITHFEESKEDVSDKILRRRKWIPLLLTSSNLVIGMGAGMTVKFFPVFFRAIYDMKPITVQLIMGATFIFTGTFAVLAQKYSLKKGRVEIMLGSKIIATVILFILALYPTFWVLIVLYIVRGALMNSVQPLSRSILMDAVPKKHRGKWNSASVISWGLFWNASAMIGGFLIGENNFRLCFLVTAGVYAVGSIPLFFLLPLVNKES
ncbi:MAG: MFS transporter [Candidatus Delongbacteria bacterium]|nr:MFS transporter [Candidatus Delongbacteria bacterium]